MLLKTPSFQSILLYWKNRLFFRSAAFYNTFSILNTHSKKETKNPPLIYMYIYLLRHIKTIRGCRAYEKIKCLFFPFG